MTDRRLVVIPGVGTLDLTEEVYQAALRPIAAATPTVHPQASNLLVTAKEMGRLTDKAASWWLAAARRTDCPVVRLGSAVRFEPEKAMRWLHETQERDANGHALAGPRPRARARSVTGRLARSSD